MADGDEATVRRPTVEALREEVRKIEDPELQMSLVDLGLIYGIEIDEDGFVTIDMTLTSPACPVGPMLLHQTYHAVRWLDGIAEVEVNLVWDPPWDPKTMAAEDVRMMLGIW